MFPVNSNLIHNFYPNYPFNGAGPHFAIPSPLSLSSVNSVPMVPAINGSSSAIPSSQPTSLSAFSPLPKKQISHTSFRIIHSSMIQEIETLKVKEQEAIKQSSLEEKKVKEKEEALRALMAKVEEARKRLEEEQQKVQRCLAVAREFQQGYANLEKDLKVLEQMIDSEQSTPSLNVEPAEMEVRHEEEAAASAALLDLAGSKRERIGGSTGPAKKRRPDTSKRLISIFKEILPVGTTVFHGGQEAKVIEISENILIKQGEKEVPFSVSKGRLTRIIYLPTIGRKYLIREKKDWYFFAEITEIVGLPNPKYPPLSVFVQPDDLKRPVLKVIRNLESLLPIEPGNPILQKLVSKDFGAANTDGNSGKKGVGYRLEYKEE